MPAQTAALEMVLPASTEEILRPMSADRATLNPLLRMARLRLIRPWPLRAMMALKMVMRPISIAVERVNPVGSDQHVPLMMIAATACASTNGVPRVPVETTRTVT